MAYNSRLEYHKGAGGEGRQDSATDRGVEGESSGATSTHPSLRRPDTPSLPDDADVDSLHKDSRPQLETPESNVHPLYRAPEALLPTVELPLRSVHIPRDCLGS